MDNCKSVHIFAFMKLQEKKKTGTIRISPEVLQEARILCATFNYNIKDYIEKLVEEGNQKLKAKCKTA